MKDYKFTTDLLIVKLDAGLKSQGFFRFKVWVSGVGGSFIIKIGIAR